MKPLETTAKTKSKSTSQKLISLLQERQCLSEEDLKLVTRLQRQSRGRSLSLTLVDVGVEEDVVQQAVADVTGLQFAKLSIEDVAKELVEKLGAGWCKDHDVLPVRIDGKAYIASSTRLYDPKMFACGAHLLPDRAKVTD